MTEEELAPCMCHVMAAQGDGDTPDAAGLGATWWLRQQSLCSMEKSLSLVIV